MSFRIIITALLFFFSGAASAQVRGEDSTALHILEPTQRQFTIKQKDGTELNILAGTVRLRQGTTLFYCDSCVVNTKTRVFEAFGNVHINDSDTAHIYSSYLRYLIDPRYAYFTKNVRLTDGKGTLTTEQLEYDLAGKIGTYKNGGRLSNNKTVITSREGVYYADIRDVYFKKNVEIKDPSHYVKSDSIIYNTETGIARFISETYLRDSSGRTIRTKEGFYDSRGGRSEFTQRTRIQDGSLIIEGDQIANDEASGIVQIRENGILIDTAQGINILANEIFANKKTGAYLATRNPLMIIRQESDSIYIKADTLFSARLSDRFFPADSSRISRDRVRDGEGEKEKEIEKEVENEGKKEKEIEKEGEEEEKEKEREEDKQGEVTAGVTTGKNSNSKLLANDSTNRYFEAFRNVKIFTDSLQAMSDSLFYSFKDSTFQLFQNPVVWSNRSQVTGDTIYLFTKNKKAHRIEVFQNSFLVNSKEEGVYNQVRARQMNGFFTDGAMDSVLTKGSSESIYFIQDQDSAYTGINQTSSDAMDVHFAQNELQRIIFRSSVKGTMWPMSLKTPSEMRLKGFLWLEARRPKTKYDLFE